VNPSNHYLKLFLLVLGIHLHSPTGLSAQENNPQVLSDQIGQQVAQMRGLPFKSTILARNQTIAEFSNYLDKELERQIPPQRARYFGKIVKKLGLYRGPEIENMARLVKAVMTSQTRAYYDSASGTFYVLASQMNPTQLGSVYAHELYHGLQDQYWDLDAYLMPQTGGELDDDQLMARQAVVEGEATYLMTLWVMNDMLGFKPDHSVIAAALQLQSVLDVASLQSMMSDQAMVEALGVDVMEAMEGMKEIPPFMIETLLSAYMKGAAFVARVMTESGDWQTQLYSRPPSSSEQILHPEKWLAGENPFRLESPDFNAAAGLEDWEIIDANAIGELQWRIIFAEFDLKVAGVEASAGWDGDRYTVFKHRETDQLLLFVYTCWDSPEDATEFAQTYRELAGIKYQHTDEAYRVLLSGSDVLIVEGGSPKTLEAKMDVLKKTSKTR
jgi:hypothetical protein